MNFTSIKRKVSIVLLAIAPLSLSSFSFSTNGGKDIDKNIKVTRNEEKNNSKTSETQIEPKPQAADTNLTNASFGSLIGKRPTTNSNVALILEEAKKFDIDIPSLQAFTDVYLKNDFTNRVCEFIDENLNITTPFVLFGIKAFLRDNFKNSAISEESRNIVFGKHLSEENLVIASGLVLQTFRCPLIREAGFFNDFLDYQDASKRKKIVSLEAYNDDNYQKIIDDRGYNSFKYEKFCKLLTTSVQAETKEVTSEKQLKELIFGKIITTQALSIDFNRLPGSFRKDQILDRMLGVIYDAYDFSFEKPKQSVPLNALDLVYFNAQDDQSQFNPSDKSYSIAVNQYGHYYRMHSFLVKFLEDNAEVIYENSTEGKELVQRLPELYIAKSFMRHKYEFGFLNLTQLQNQSEIIASGEYPLKKLTEKFSGLVNFEKYLKTHLPEVDLSKTFSSNFFNELKLLSTNNSSELFYFTLDDILSKKQLKSVSYNEAANIYLLCQIINSKNQSFFTGNTSSPVKKNRIVKIDEVINKFPRQGHETFTNPKNDYQQLELAIPSRCFYQQDKSTN